MLKVHYLKTWPEYYEDVKSGRKRFEIRKDDRPDEPYEVGDMLILQEFDPETGYTGAEDLIREVTYILRKQPFVPEGYVCMSLKG
jgi:ASC-1-like (ASCH) protein